MFVKVVRVRSVLNVRVGGIVMETSIAMLDFFKQNRLDNLTQKHAPTVSQRLRGTNVLTMLAVKDASKTFAGNV